MPTRRCGACGGNHTFFYHSNPFVQMGNMSLKRFLREAQSKTQTRFVPCDSRDLIYQLRPGALETLWEREYVGSMQNEYAYAEIHTAKDVLPFGDVTFLILERRDKRPLMIWEVVQELIRGVLGDGQTALEVYPARYLPDVFNDGVNTNARFFYCGDPMIGLHTHGRAKEYLQAAARYMYHL